MIYNIHKPMLEIIIYAVCFYTLVNVSCVMGFSHKTSALFGSITHSFLSVLLSLTIIFSYLLNTNYPVIYWLFSMEMGYYLSDAVILTSTYIKTKTIKWEECAHHVLAGYLIYTDLFVNPLIAATVCLCDLSTIFLHTITILFYTKNPTPIETELIKNNKIQKFTYGSYFILSFFLLRIVSFGIVILFFITENSFISKLLFYILYGLNIYWFNKIVRLYWADVHKIIKS